MGNMTGFYENTIMQTGFAKQDRILKAFDWTIRIILFIICIFFIVVFFEQIKNQQVSVKQYQEPITEHPTIVICAETPEEDENEIDFVGKKNTISRILSKIPLKFIHYIIRYIFSPFLFSTK